MAQTHKILGQSNPAASGLTTLYTVPAATQTICSTLSICNTGSSSTTYRVAVRPTGAAIATSQYIAYDTTIPANDTTALTFGITLSATDVISIYAANANLAFSLFGCEVT